jgi:AcrR family transcriptional regulator
MNDTRDRILQVALDLFIEQGYEKTSLREIAERIGVSKAALYYHFASKEEIFRTLLEPILALQAQTVGMLQSRPSREAWGKGLADLVAGILPQRRLFELFEKMRAHSTP